MKKLILLITLIFAIFSNVSAFDTSTLGPINSSVIDKVGILKSEEKTEIETKIEDLRKKYTTEILTVIIPTTSSEEISSVATEIGQKIGVGKADKDNGVVILIAIDDRAWNIATGYGVEGVLPDLLTKRIGEKNFTLFKESRYKDGIIGVLNDFDKAFSGDTSIMSNNNTFSDTTNSLGFFEVVLAFIISVTISSLFFKPLLKNGKYLKFFKYLIIIFIISFFPIYIIIFNIINSLILNIVLWLIGILFGVYGDGLYFLINMLSSSKGGKYGGGSRGGGGGFGGFGGGGFGGGGSSGKW